MNPSQLIDLASIRARKARLGKHIGKSGFTLLKIGSGLGLLGAAALMVTGSRSAAYFVAAFGLSCALLALWYKRDLTVLPVTGTSYADQLSVAVLQRLKPGLEQTPQSLWKLLLDHWQAIFFLNHLLLTDELVTAQLSNDPAALAPVLLQAQQFASEAASPTIEPGFIIGALLLSSPEMSQLLAYFKLQPSDIASLVSWLGRGLNDLHREKQDFGGIGRDWAFGFTPTLERFGENISLGITKYGAHFGWLTKSAGVAAIEAAFANHASAVALVGAPGIGKTSSIYALAQRLIEGNTDRSLAYHQIISLNASVIISSARGPGELEQIVLHLANEAAHAGHVILFFDDAQLFFTTGVGSFDVTQILLPIVQARSIPIIFALTPEDYQRLRTTNPSLSSLLTPVVLQEPPQSDVMRVLEDTALGLEGRHHIVVSYEALREAYRLSGRYEQEEAYPGKAIKLLEQSVSHTEHSIVTAISVQQAIEQTRGVKVSTAGAAEADTLLHLEDKIHQRMINQTHAVSVVASALRRARAGVANPRRPIGSFLFLGPTGVGKTELAKAIAATYFGAEQSIIRLDMSEYQQPNDVQRLLSSGQDDSSSLIMAARASPFSVVLLDEIEKAHPNVLNLLLQLLDEGKLTDQAGRAASFKDCVIIATSNAGATTIRERVAAGQSLDSFSQEFTDELIRSNQFKPELLNRFDEIVLFRPLNADELGQVTRLMLGEINQTLANQNISVELTDAAIALVVERGNDPRLGARPMRRTLQRAVEDVIAEKILRGEAQPGSHLTLDAPDLKL